jgi:hypothetical protein
VVCADRFLLTPIVHHPHSIQAELASIFAEDSAITKLKRSGQHLGSAFLDIATKGSQNSRRRTNAYVPSLATTDEFTIRHTGSDGTQSYSTERILAENMPMWGRMLKCLQASRNPIVSLRAKW